MYVLSSSAAKDNITYVTIRFTETVNTIFVSANLRTKWSGCQFEFEEIHLDTFV